MQGHEARIPLTDDMRVRPGFTRAAVATLICEVVKMTLHTAPESDPTPSEESPWDEHPARVVAHLQRSMAYAQEHVYHRVPWLQDELQDIRWMLQETFDYQRGFGPSHDRPQ